MNAPERAFLPDVQAFADTRAIAIDRVGVKAIRHPIEIRRADGSTLATVATVIASQATISGACSMAQQSALLGLSARIRVDHTSESEFGQVYVPAINWLLLAGVIALVLFFKSSSALAAASAIMSTALT